jgi:hypothetical protein
VHPRLRDCKYLSHGNVPAEEVHGPVNRSSHPCDRPVV